MIPVDNYVNWVNSDVTVYKPVNNSDQLKSSNFDATHLSKEDDRHLYSTGVRNIFQDKPEEIQFDESEKILELFKLKRRKATQTLRRILGKIKSESLFTSPIETTEGSTKKYQSKCGNCQLENRNSLVRTHGNF